MKPSLESARRTLAIEAAAINVAADRLDDGFDVAVELLVNAGRVLVTGIGKSGSIARKIAATFTSTGTAAHYIHPIDSLHGDLGLISSDAVVVMLSKSGETEELLPLLAVLGRRSIPVIAITGGTDSTLARAARAVLDGSVREEACPHDLAPTTSTTVALALGDALAVALLEAKGFRREDFAELHPGGMLGRRLLLRVRDVMVPPTDVATPASTLRDVVIVLARGRGIAPIVEGGRVIGVVTAGDLTRLVERNAADMGRPAIEIMTAAPRTVIGDELAATAVGLFERHGIAAAPVLDDSESLIGILHLHDLLRAGAG